MQVMMDDSVQGFFEHKGTQPYDVELYECRLTRCHMALTDAVFTAALSPTDNNVVTGDGNDLAYLWDLTSGQKRFELKGLNWGTPACLD